MTIFDLITIGKDSQAINKKVVESLILVGACSSLNKHRAELFESLDMIIDFGSKFFKNINRNQESLFDNTNQAEIQYPKLKKIDEWPIEKQLKYEKELLGFYLSNNPLAKYEQDFMELSTLNSEGINKYGSEKVNIGGIILSFQLRYDKNGNQWAILSLDTYSGSIQVYVFHSTYLQYIDLIQEDNIIFIKGKISNQSDNNQVSQIIADKLFTADNIRSRLTNYINIRLEYVQNTQDYIVQLTDLCDTYAGNTIIMLHLITANGRQQRIQSNKFKVNPNQEFITKLRIIFGNKNVWIS